MINHSTLMEAMKKMGLPPTFYLEISSLTKGGVVMEAGPAIANIKPTDPVSMVFRSDLPIQATDGAAEKATSGGFVLGKSSLRELEGVDATLVAVVKLAIQLTEVDFTVYDGIRTVKEQTAHVKNGTSKTMKSKHLDGLAVDLVPWINGKPVWDWTGCYKIAYAMDIAATQLGCADRITWGGAWDRRLSDFGGDLGSYEQEVKLYRSRHSGPDFIDGPHFEIRSK